MRIAQKAPIKVKQFVLYCTISMEITEKSSLFSVEGTKSLEEMP